MGLESCYVSIQCGTADTLCDKPIVHVFNRSALASSRTEIPETARGNLLGDWINLNHVLRESRNALWVQRRDRSPAN